MVRFNDPDLMLVVGGGVAMLVVLVLCTVHKLFFRPLKTDAQLAAEFQRKHGRRDGPRRPIHVYSTGGGEGLVRRRR